ncbi:MAG: hypothetical protein ACI854_002385 [Arenicella sp.]|jgi:hypothetical protein
MKIQLSTLLFIVLSLAAIDARGSGADITGNGTIVIAIVDDAFRPSHEVFNERLWINTNEVPNNGLDDDSNGYIDDIYGWDMSDQDAELLPPPIREKEFAHGTNMAGIIVSTLAAHFGSEQPIPVKLMFVKAASDVAQPITLKDGYKGIEYALDNGADIISLSWGGGKLTTQASQALARARAAGVTIIASLGTYPQVDPSYPSAHPGVIGVAGVDEFGALLTSNFGGEVDLLAQSSSIRVADVTADDAYWSSQGVSNSVAIVSAQAAIVKQANPALTSQELKHCLLSTASAQDEQNLKIAGQLGAGLVNLNDAIACANNIGREVDQIRQQAKGSILYSRKENNSSGASTWKLRPKGEYAGILLKPFIQGKPKKSTIRFTSKPDNVVLWQGPLSEVPSTIESSAADIDIELSAKTKSAFQFGLQYATKNINFAQIYCKGVLVVDQPGVIDDGSGDNQYAANSDCKWLIKAVEGYDIGFQFTQLDTEVNVDSVYLFRGETTQQNNFLMRVSGSQLPYKAIVEQDDALLWFVSDEKNQGAGFSVTITREPKRSLLKPSEND